ncbi:radical SAM protein, partial [Selenomonas montiformis]|uniref:radical SAM protein n=1 Tax=Selenomonas montiformis TaxID=2652285 RepID=UPI003F969F2E
MLFSIHRIFLMLGPECNLQCKYCLQHDMASSSRKQVSQEVIHWIKTQVRSQSSKFTITFYGGEPLIYWDAIQQTIREIGDSVSFSIITNGKLLDEEKVNYLNDHHVYVAISWDGKHVMETRGYDVLKSNPNIAYI